MRLAGWRYNGEEGGRDLRYDLLRGFALLIMAINHLPARDSLLYAISGRARFVISAAEGFYFLSGLVLGIVAARRPVEEAIRHTRRRALTLYAVTVGLGLAHLVLSRLTAAPVWGRPIPTNIGLAEAILSIPALIRAPGGAAILLPYVLFLLGAPPALRALARGRAWRVIAASEALYLAAQLWPPLRGLFAPLFSPAAWQILFFGGLAIGYRRGAIGAAWAQVPLRRALDGLAVAVTLALLAIHAGGYAILPGLPEALGDRGGLTPLRLVLVAACLRAAVLLVTFAWRPLRAALGWLLLPPGQASLWTFVMHLALFSVLMSIPGPPPPGIWPGTARHALGVAMLWALAVGRNAALRRWRGARANR